jgi:hypothetical protein
VPTGTGRASAFVWASQNPSGFANRRWAIAKDGRSPATIDLMPARGFVAYRYRHRRQFPPAPLPPLAAQGSIGPNNPRLVLPPV